MTAPSQGPHRRFNPLLDEWVLCSPQRLSRPWQGRTETVATAALPAYDPTCYLCPGNERAEGARNPDYETTFVFDNDFPALTLDAPESASPDPLLRAEPAPGICRVVCFSPRHDLTLARMDAAAIGRVIETWAEQVLELESRDPIAYVQVFENRGELMGCSNPHPHGQIWATGYVPGIPARKLAAQRRYREQYGRDLLGDYLARELADGERVVDQNDHWAVVVPFWAIWPFETMLVPKRSVAALPDVTPEERLALAEAIQSLGARYDNLFSCPFPFSMGWHGRPARDEAPGCRLHAVYMPPLLRSATVRKFLVGFELTAEPQRDLTPEAAASRLRETSDRHRTA